MAGKKMEGNEEQRRQKAREAKRAGQLPSDFKLASQLIGERANRMGNRGRASKLHGRPQLNQRPHDDLKGAPSLFV